MYKKNQKELVREREKENGNYSDQKNNLKRFSAEKQFIMSQDTQSKQQIQK